jgi:hypothetical protein
MLSFQVRSAWARFVTAALLTFLAGIGFAVVPDLLIQALGLEHEPNPATVFIPLAAGVVSLLIAGVGAWQLRSWWAMLVIPAVYCGGYLLGALLGLIFSGSAIDPGYIILGLGVFGVFLLAPLLLVTLIVTVISRRRAQPASPLQHSRPQVAGGATPGATALTRERSESRIHHVMLERDGAPAAGARRQEALSLAAQG